MADDDDDDDGGVVCEEEDVDGFVVVVAAVDVAVVEVWSCSDDDDSAAALTCIPIKQSPQATSSLVEVSKTSEGFKAVKERRAPVGRSMWAILVSVSTSSNFMPLASAQATKLPLHAKHSMPR
jgi:hypothetical protein